jgi:AmmeMemoRadiSam system protein A
MNDNASPKNGHAGGPMELTAAEKRTLLRLARAAVEAAAAGQRERFAEPDDLTPALRRPADCFVTLYKFGELRGCIGSRGSSEPLWRAVIDSATASATRDPRFLPVEPHEVHDLEIHISVLTPPRPLQWQSEAGLRASLKPHVHGVTIRNGYLRALYLPAVWEHFEGSSDIVAAFLSSLSRKAGDPTGQLWRDRRTAYEVFESLDFGEADADLAD